MKKENSNEDNLKPRNQFNFDNEQNAFQLIDSQKKFNPDTLKILLNHFKTHNNYKVVSIIGTQSTGKSTLLNRVFNINFHVMNDKERKQTTKGVWFSCSSSIGSLEIEKESIFILDIEGTDGRERGEDQDFERKSVLFALSVSDVLMINVWESQIGLYQGSNIALLKIVFEVNLQLFGNLKTSKSRKKKVILFIIRDYIGITPIKNLIDIINNDVINVWKIITTSISSRSLNFNDFFTLEFFTLHHMLLQSELFDKDVKELEKSFTSETSFFAMIKSNSIPIDGWILYIENCWKQILENKELDLPTQEVLVAKFKCDEIIVNIYDTFSKELNNLITDFHNHNYDHNDVNLKNTGEEFSNMISKFMTKFTNLASRYNQYVFDEKKVDLEKKITGKMDELICLYIDSFILYDLKQFEIELQNIECLNFILESTKLSKDFECRLKKKLILLKLNDKTKLDNFFIYINKKIFELIENQKQLKFNKFLKKNLKKIEKKIECKINEEINYPTESTWNNINDSFKKFRNDFFANFKNENNEIDFNLNLKNDLQFKAIEKFNFDLWIIFYHLIHKINLNNNVFYILKKIFKRKFIYDEKGLPKIYYSTKEVEFFFLNSKKYMVDSLSILSNAVLNDKSTLSPDINISDLRFQNDILNEYKNENINKVFNKEEFSKIIDDIEKKNIIKSLEKDINVQFLETKKSIIQTKKEIPYYIYVIILILGWNQLLILFKHPFLISLISLIFGLIYILNNFFFFNSNEKISKLILKKSLVYVKNMIPNVNWKWFRK